MESTARAASQYFGDLFMSLIPTCQLCGANSFGYLIELQWHTAELAAHSADWMPWNYRDMLAAAGDTLKPILAMKKQARNHVNRKLSESDGAPAKPTGAVSGEFVTEMFEYDGGRQVTVYVPADPPEAIVFAGDGQRISKWGRLLEKADVPSTMIVGVHGLTDETLRLHEYSPGFEPERFAANENFFVEDVRRWTESRFGVALPIERTAVFGVSAGGELALALGLRHPQVYGAVFCASPGGGYKPPGVMPSPLPRTYLVAGTQEPFFLENARRWADALRDADADVVMNERAGSHGGAFWREELPLMVAWAFGR